MVFVKKTKCRIDKNASVFSPMFLCNFFFIFTCRTSSQNLRISSWITLLYIYRRRHVWHAVRVKQQPAANVTQNKVEVWNHVLLIYSVLYCGNNTAQCVALGKQLTRHHVDHTVIVHWNIWVYNWISRLYFIQFLEFFNTY